MKRSTSARALLLYVLLVFVAAACISLLICLRKKPQAVKTPPVRFAYQDRVADAASIIAIEKGYFAREGVFVKPIRFTSGPACSETLYAASADIGTMGDATAVIAVSRGAPVRIIASHGGGERRHRIVVAPDSPIKEAAQLLGKRVAVKKGTSTFGGFLRFLKAHRIDPPRIAIVDMRPADMPEALFTGSVDAFVASEPTPSVAESKGARELATLEGLGNSYPILLVARKSFLESRHLQAVRFLRALIKASEFISLHRKEAAEIIAQLTSLSAPLAERAMSHHSYEVGLDSLTVESLRRTAVFLKEEGTIAFLPDFAVSTDKRYLKEALRKGAR